jgi:hypothetical protein
MSSNRFVMAALAGGVAIFFLGFLLYGVLTASYFEGQHMEGTLRESPDFFHLAVGQLAFGVFLAIAIGKWARVGGAMAGLQVGALTGLIIGIGFDLTMFATSHIVTIEAALVDPLIFMLQMGGGGAVVGAVLGMKK